MHAYTGQVLTHMYVYSHIWESVQASLNIPAARISRPEREIVARSFTSHKSMNEGGDQLDQVSLN